MNKLDGNQNRHSGRKGRALYFALFINFTILCLIVNLPFAQAYFSKRKTSEIPHTVLIVGPSKIKIEGPDKVVLPAPPDPAQAAGENEGPALMRSGAESAVLLVYKAEVLDQFDRPMPEEVVIWDILGGPYPGIYISAGGEVVVTSEAAPGIYTIVAISASDENVVAFFELELVAPEAPEGGNEGEEKEGEEEPGEGESGPAEPAETSNEDSGGEQSEQNGAEPGNSQGDNTAAPELPGSPAGNGDPAGTEAPAGPDEAGEPGEEEPGEEAGEAGEPGMPGDPSGTGDTAGDDNDNEQGDPGVDPVDGEADGDGGTNSTGEVPGGASSQGGQPEEAEPETVDSDVPGGSDPAGENERQESME